MILPGSLHHRCLFDEEPSVTLCVDTAPSFLFSQPIQAEGRLTCGSSKCLTVRQVPHYWWYPKLKPCWVQFIKETYMCKEGMWMSKTVLPADFSCLQAGNCSRGIWRSGLCTWASTVRVRWIKLQIFGGFSSESSFQRHSVKWKRVSTLSHQHYPFLSQIFC